MRYFFTFLTVALFISASSPDKSHSEIQWVSFEEAVELNKENPRKILIDLYTDWCGWCKRMDQTTYSNSIIVDYINENFYAVKFDAEQRQDVKFQGHTFKFVPSGRRGYHQLAAALTNNKLSYPTTVFMDEQLRIISPVPGYIKSPEFHTILNFIAKEKYKTTPYQEFQKDFSKVNDSLDL
jgi:thioredoxin-related protein